MPLTPVKTVRAVHLAKRDDGKFVWLYEDDTVMEGKSEFGSKAEACDYLFTAVVVEATTTPEAPK